MYTSNTHSTAAKPSGDLDDIYAPYFIAYMEECDHKDEGDSYTEGSSNEDHDSEGSDMEECGSEGSDNEGRDNESTMEVNQEHDCTLSS